MVTVQNRYRHIPGGLDNAVKQAEQKGFYDMFIVDTDVHQMEPFSLFGKYMPEKWKNEFVGPDLPAEHTVYDADPRIFKMIYGDEKPSLAPEKVNRYFSGRNRRPEVSYPKPQSPEEVIDTFSRRMQDIGIKKCVVFPTTMLALGKDPRLDLEVAVANAYIDYMLDNFLGKYPEILTMVHAPANSPEKAAELIDRVGSEKGVVGVMISPNRSVLGGSDTWNPMYEAAQKKNLPICFHADGSLGGPFSGLNRYVTVHALAFPFYLMLQLTSLVMEGVPERFPRLPFIFMEGGVSWIPWIMHRLDSEYFLRESEAPLLRKAPSRYIKDFYWTSQPLERPYDISEQEALFKMFDAENHLMFASDYPHWDWDVPSVIYDLPFLSKEAKKKILGETAARLFRLK